MVPYLIRWSKRSRRISVSLDKFNQAIVTVPQRLLQKMALEFLEECGDWLLEHMAKNPQPKSLLEYLRDKPRLSLNGKLCKLSFATTNRCPYCEYETGSEAIILRYNFEVHQEERIREALHKLARVVLPQRLNQLCEAKQIQPPARVTVRNQSSRWGSCSFKRGISLNWRLILLPVALQDYVILHELAHLKEMNHSAVFWDLLQSYDSKSSYNDQRINELGRAIITLG